MKKKFFLHALVLLMVFSFASMASATTYAYFNSDYLIGTIDVASDGKLTVNAPTKSFDMTWVRLFPAGENVLAIGGIYTPITESLISSTYKNRIVLLDKSLTVINSVDITIPSEAGISISNPVLFNGKILATMSSNSSYDSEKPYQATGSKRIVEIDPASTKIDITTAKNFDVAGAIPAIKDAEAYYSLSQMLVNDNVLYFMGQASYPVSYDKDGNMYPISSDYDIYNIGEFGGTFINRNKIFSMNTFPTVANSADMAADIISLPDMTVANGTIYAGGRLSGSESSWGIYKLDPSALKFSQVVPTASPVHNPDAICSDGDNGLYFTSFVTLNSGNGYRTTRKIYHWDGTASSDVTSDDIIFNVITKLDYDATAQVLSITGIGKIATYKLTGGKFALVDSADDAFGSIEKFEEAANSNETVIVDVDNGDITELPTESQDALVTTLKNSGLTITSSEDIVGATEATVTPKTSYTAPSSSVAEKIETGSFKLSTSTILPSVTINSSAANGSNKLTWISSIISTPSTLRGKAISAVKICLVEGILASLGSVSTATAGDVINAVILDENNQPVTGTIPATIVLAANVDAGQTYDIYAATVSNDDNDNNNSSSGSSGGCDVSGFGILGFLILAAALKLKK